MQNKIVPTVTATLIAALEDIKEAIKQDPHREIVGDQTLTLVKIYAIVEEAEKQVNLQHK